MTRRTQYDLNKAEERDHILQGLLIALDYIDEVISIIRGSANVSMAKEKLIARFYYIFHSCSNKTLRYPRIYFTHTHF